MRLKELYTARDNTGINKLYAQSKHTMHEIIFLKEMVHKRQWAS